MISPLNQGDEKEKPKEWSNTTKFSDVARLRSEIRADFGTCFDGENFQIGYIKPGHGARGQQIPNVYTEDLECMYSRCSCTKQILLWAKPLQKKDMSSGVSGLRVRKRPGSKAVGGPAKKSRHGGNSLQQAQEPEYGTGSSSNSWSKYSAEHNRMFEL